MKSDLDYIKKKKKKTLQERKKKKIKVKEGPKN
jgi:hypothetical protein